MTTYTTITNALVAVGAKPFATTIQALRDNPLAIAEGDATAPSLLPAIANKSVAGAVGTYMFARSTAGTDTAFGGTRAGSDLLPVSAIWETNGSAGSLAAGSAQAGTWRAMGQFDYTNNPISPTAFGATLWLRIS